MGEVLSQSVVLMLIVVLGYVLKKVHIFGPKDYKIVTKLVMYCTLPCTIINGFSKFDWDNSLLIIPLFAFGVNTVLQIISYLYSRRADNADKIFYMLNTPGFSMGTFALPFIQNSMGTEGIVAACMFDSLGTIYPSGLSYVCTNAALADDGGRQRPPRGFAVKKLFTSPPFLVNIVMIILKLTSLELPSAVYLFTDKVSDANGFVCMLMIGMMFELKFQWKYMKKVIKLIGTRLAVSACAAVIILKLLPLDALLANALVVAVFSPIAALSLVYTDTMDGDTEMAGFVNSVSIVVSMITMTALMMALA